MKKAITLSLIAALIVIPMVMPLIFALPAAGQSQQPFDMVYLFIEQVFGNVVVAGIGLTIIFILIGMLSRMSTTTVILVNLLFIMCYFMAAWGGLVVFLAAIVTLFYFISGLLNWINALRS